MLIKCAATTLSSKLVSTERQYFAEMCVDAVRNLDDALPVNMIGMKKVPGGSLKVYIHTFHMCFNLSLIFCRTLV